MLTFRDFMEQALYAPGRGFYETRTPAEDFYTAPELHPAFASVLAAEAVKRLESLSARKIKEPYFLVEMGSGAGTLGLQILRALREKHPAWVSRIRYVFVERVESNLLQSILAAAAMDARVLGYSRLEDVPPCAGVLLSNELLDALPVHLLEKRGGRMLEVYVRPRRPDEEDCRTELGELSTPELAAAAETLTPYLPEGGRHAVSLEALRWLQTAARTLAAGAVITVDYGKRFAGATPNLPRMYFRHTTGQALTARPGRQDLTAPVDFEALIREGRRFGLELDSYVTLGRFLLEGGILDMLPAGAPSDLQAYEERNRIKTLFHPEGMGEAFKVLIQEKMPS